MDEQNGIIRVSRSFDKRTKKLKSTKSGSWRNVDINSQLAALISDLRKERGGEEFVLPRFADWNNGAAGKILRAFLKSIGIETEVVFHTLRACFATHLLSMGVEPLKVMRMGGWSDLKTFQIYLRLAGVDVAGVTKDLNLMPE